MTLTLLHAADLDLDAPVMGVGSTPPEVRTALRDASLAAWDRLVQTAIDQGVTAVVLAGGVCRDRTMSPRARVALASGVSRLWGADIATVILGDGHGDGERVGWEADVARSPGVQVVGMSPVEVVTIERAGHDPFTIHAFGTDGGDLAGRVQASHRTGAAGLQIGLLRGSINAGPGSPASAEQVSIEDFRHAGLDYWAMGGDHHGRVVAEEPWVVIAGTLQGRGFGTPESGPKGAMLVTAEGSEVRGVRPVPLDVVRFASVVVDLASLGRVADISQAMVAAVEGVAVESGQLVVVRGILTGSGPVRDDVRRPGAIGEILATLAEIGSGQDRAVWWDSVVDRTVPDLDFDAIRDRGDLSTEVLRLGQELREDPDTLAAWARSLEGITRLGPGDAVPMVGSGDDPVTWAALLSEAEAIAIAELDRDGEA